MKTLKYAVSRLTIMETYIIISIKLVPEKTYCFSCFFPLYRSPFCQFVEN